MPLFNYGQPFGQAPGYSPGGRGLNPGTGRIGSLPGGMDFLAGLGPAPSGVTDWVDPAIINNKRLAAPQGASNPLSAFLLGLQRWGRPNTNASAINMFNARHGATVTPQQAGVPVTQATTPAAPQAAPQVNFQNPTATNFTKPLIGELASFDTQWNDQNDPGGFIRKHQAALAGQPWANSLSGAGAMYGVGKTTGIGG